MKLVKITFKDIIKYTFSNPKTILLIATLMLGISFLINISESREDIISPLCAIISYILLFMEVGYGDEIIKTSYMEYEAPPKLNNVDVLIKKGFRKTLIYLAYGVISIMLFNLQRFILNDIVAIICDILIIVVNVLLCLGIINSFVHNGRLRKAFNLKEMLMLFKQFKIKKLIYVIISILIGQTFVVSCFVDIHPGFTIIDILLMIATFFLAPLSLISTKRFIGLALRETV